ncbi:YggT family protein [Aeromicrobium sp. SMF47]|uniref:YggT family protein n=1 Tax=Aeromicrobium yanjiei TaxID=2662028 RepID=A0A5Q2MH74_9ACTN|nr:MULTISPECIES: YggT family protein [Aeromicrobium]MRJ77790.1 YggT family protein [Aeromicrobium yanjiei]MRK02159.1 YggT family protein [Aeromicrobium sp. S22]QGG41119.1 YggT family protein [Aeromicrobium yanjiei]
METVGYALNLVLWIALVLLIARFVLDWVQLLARNWRPRGIVLVICEGLYSLTDPPLRAVRGVIPPLRLGQVVLDLSPMILIIAIYILQAIVRAVFF